MNAPFYKLDLFSHDFSLIVALVIGIGFGFTGMGIARYKTGKW